MRRSDSGLAFIDLLFNTLLGFVILFFLAFILINPVAKVNDMPVRAELLMIVEWPGAHANDIDIWVEGPGKKVIGFQNKVEEAMHLDRDDLGKNDVTYVDGIPMNPETSREIVTFRGISPGDYYVNLHVYYGKTFPSSVTVTFMDLNPVREVYKNTVAVNKQGDIITLPGFSIDAEGNVAKVFSSSKIVVPFK